MKTGVRIRKILLSVIAISIAAVSLLMIGTSSLNTPNRFDMVQLDDGWTISRGGISWDLPSIKTSNIGTANKNDEIILTRTLPDYDFSPATINYRTVLSTTKVYVDGELLYTFGDDYASKNKMLPKMEHFIQLPENSQGKEIRIHICAQENSAFSGLSTITLGNYNDIKNSILQDKRLSMVIGVYLCHLGFMLMIVAPFLAFSQNHDFSIFFSAITSVLMGVYLLCYNGIFWYISDNPAFFTFVEYFCLFTIPAAILGFILTAGQSNSRELGLILFVLNLCFVFSTALLHFFNIVHICNFVPWLHILGLVEGIFVIISLAVAAVHNYKDDSAFRSRISSTNTLIGGLIFFLFCALIDIVKFNIMKQTRFGEVNVQINFTTFGSLVFIMSLLLNYFYHCIEYISVSSVTSQLEGLAYVDALTGLSNRARCQQMLAELTGDFTIISLDLDYLKYTNDNYGHDKGDRLLSGFAQMLQDSFTDASLVGRMGGDEFIAVLPYVDDKRIQRDLSCLTDLMNFKSGSEHGLRFSASWGYAASTDQELAGCNSAQNVYLLADKRMYTMKNKHHQQSLGRLYDDLLNKITEEGGRP